MTTRVESYREVLLYPRSEEEPKVKLAPNEEVVSSEVVSINGEPRWTFIIKKTTAR